MNHSFLTVRGLDYSIDGTEILQDVSLEVPEGTFVGLIAVSYTHLCPLYRR